MEQVAPNVHKDILAKIILLQHVPLVLMAKAPTLLEVRTPQIALAVMQDFSHLKKHHIFVLHAKQAHFLVLKDPPFAKGVLQTNIHQPLLKRNVKSALQERQLQLVPLYVQQLSHFGPQKLLLVFL
jgi:hypothetical protein